MLSLHVFKEKTQAKCSILLKLKTKDNAHLVNVVYYDIKHIDSY